VVDVSSVRLHGMSAIKLTKIIIIKNDGIYMLFCSLFVNSRSVQQGRLVLIKTLYRLYRRDITLGSL